MKDRDTNMERAIIIIHKNMYTRDNSFLIKRKAMDMPNTPTDKFTKVSGGRTKNREKEF